MSKTPGNSPRHPDFVTLGYPRRASVFRPGVRFGPSDAEGGAHADGCCGQADGARRQAAGSPRREGAWPLPPSAAQRRKIVGLALSPLRHFQEADAGALPALISRRPEEGSKRRSAKSRKEMIPPGRNWTPGLPPRPREADVDRIERVVGIFIERHAKAKTEGLEGDERIGARESPADGRGGACPKSTAPKFMRCSNSISIAERQFARIECSPSFARCAGGRSHAGSSIAIRVRGCPRLRRRRAAIASFGQRSPLHMGCL